MQFLSNRKVQIGIALIALMAATRSNLFNHFGTANFLPDASLAVFILAGFFIASPAFFAALFLEAVVIDYLAITQFGVSDFCITPAYWGLIPTYLVLWAAGRFYARIAQHNLRSLSVFAAIAFVALSIAFFISNGAFYAFSGRFPDMNMTDYVARVAQYYVPYLSSGVTYLVPAALIYALAQQRLKAHA
ncbi:MAG: hypothetical protein PXX73_09320 [Sideroxydans sp.]|nr:hypothetical protein [Sideroxydans sp.]